MSAINPEAAEPTSTQGFGQSDRDPAINTWGAGGGFLAVPGEAESRITQAGPGPSANAGLASHNDRDGGERVEDEAEREG